ncbi:MAG: hypothetical protein AAGD13_13845 [Pseudomonadota bacterium]
MAQSLTRSLAELLVVRAHHETAEDCGGQSERDAEPSPNRAEDTGRGPDLLTLSDVDLARRGLSRGVLALRYGS